eukprot:gene15171-biopygen12706
MREAAKGKAASRGRTSEGGCVTLREPWGGGGGGGAKSATSPGRRGEGGAGGRAVPKKWGRPAPRTAALRARAGSPPRRAAAAPGPLVPLIRRRPRAPVGPGPAAAPRGRPRRPAPALPSLPQPARLQVVHRELSTRRRRTHRPRLVAQRVQVHPGIPPHKRARHLGPPPVQQALQDGRVRHSARHIRTPQAPPSERAQR